MHGLIKEELSTIAWTTNSRDRSSADGKHLQNMGPASAAEKRLSSQHLL